MIGKLFKGSNIVLLLLIFVPISIVVEYVVHAGETVIFIFSVLAIIPLASLLAKATEHLAGILGPGRGALLSSTFSNAPELIIGIVALRQGMFDVLKGSLTGSIIGNILLVFGLGSALAGFRYPILRFNRTVAGVGSTMLGLSAIGLLLPAIFHNVVKSSTAVIEQRLGLSIAIILFSTYVFNLLFALKTHRHLYMGITAAVEANQGGFDIIDNEADVVHKEAINHKEGMWRSIIQLAVAAAFIAWMSELMIAAVQGTAEQMGMSQIFVGVIIVAIVGNSVENSTSVMMALKNKADLAINICIGSSMQIALFVAPMLIMLSYFIAPTPMDLTFSTMEVVAVLIAVAVMSATSNDGDIHWIEGVQLLAVYLMIAVAFYFIPVI